MLYLIVFGSYVEDSKLGTLETRKESLVDAKWFGKIRPSQDIGLSGDVCCLSGTATHGATEQITMSTDCLKENTVDSFLCRKL